MIHLLEKLAIAITQVVEDQQVQAAAQVATELEKIDTLPPWLPGTDFRFYLGLAQFYSINEKAAEATLSTITPDSLGAAEAHWILMKMLSKRLTKKPENAEVWRSQMFKHDQEIANLYPYSLMVQYVANVQTSQREAQLGRYCELLTMPTVEIGRCYDWQTLVAVGDLYYEQNFFEDAANAYHFCIQVRYPDEWFQNGIENFWLQIADCYEQKGHRSLAARYFAKSLALPLTSSQISPISTHLKTLLEANDTPESMPDSPVYKPDAQKLRQIGDMLLEMEMFDEAVKAYQQVEQIGVDMKFAIASVLETKAQFLFDYRCERTEGTVLFGTPLSWGKIAQAYDKAKQSYLHIQPSTNESLQGIQRCQKALAYLNPDKQLEIKHKVYDN